MHRLYSDFPLALPGLGLLLLRVVLSALLLIEGVSRAAGALDAAGPGAGFVYGTALILLGIPVALGFLSPIVHVLVALVEAISPIAGLVVLSGDRWHVSILEIGIALALAMIGPGAYSIDSRLFGRREIVIRPRLVEPHGEGTAPRK